MVQLRFYIQGEVGGDVEIEERGIDIGIYQREGVDENGRHDAIVAVTPLGTLPVVECGGVVADAPHAVYRVAFGEDGSVGLARVVVHQSRLRVVV